MISSPHYSHSLLKGQLPWMCERLVSPVPLVVSFAYPLPPLILVALLSFLRLRKLLRRFVQAALGNFGGLPFHASFLTTLCPASQP